MKTWKSISFLALLPLLAIGCASRTSSHVYSRYQAQTVQNADEGQVINVRPVEIEGSVSGLGVVAGSIMGHAIGGTIGEGSGQELARVFGTIAGALFGAAAEESASRQSGLEVTVRMDYGEVIAIVQAADEEFYVGDRVWVLRHYDGSARVVPQTHWASLGPSL